ncbi:unnamed protein product, partial [Mesorhabditis belari]|uniref:BPTI/Kunitz inhibitor domain-containing protein n=1 Tax=Mesorhabditis belari TaxID=2138241 RepID=A0AAF3FAY2_9BILA
MIVTLIDVVSSFTVVVPGMEIASQPKKKYDVGTCEADIERWYFDWTLKRCVCSWWSGCGGNSNRFYSANHCLEICGQFSLGDPLFVQPDWIPVRPQYKDEVWAPKSTIQPIHPLAFLNGQPTTTLNDYRPQIPSNPVQQQQQTRSTVDPVPSDPSPTADYNEIFVNIDYPQATKPFKSDPYFTGKFANEPDFEQFDSDAVLRGQFQPPESTDSISDSKIEEIPFSRRRDELDGAFNRIPFAPDYHDNLLYQKETSIPSALRIGNEGFATGPPIEPEEEYDEVKKLRKVRRAVGIELSKTKRFKRATKKSSSPPGKQKQESTFQYDVQQTLDASNDQIDQPPPIQTTVISLPQKKKRIKGNSRKFEKFEKFEKQRTFGFEAMKVTEKTKSENQFLSEINPTPILMSKNQFQPKKPLISPSPTVSTQEKPEIVEPEHGDFFPQSTTRMPFTEVTSQEMPTEAAAWTRDQTLFHAALPFHLVSTLTPLSRPLKLKAPELAVTTTTETRSRQELETNRVPERSEIPKTPVHYQPSDGIEDLRVVEIVQPTSSPTWTTSTTAQSTKAQATKAPFFRPSTPALPPLTAQRAPKNQVDLWGWIRNAQRQGITTATVNSPTITH